MATAAAAAVSGPSWTDIVTAIGTVLAGLALPLAFIQLGGLRQDRLRAQVSRVGAWTGTPTPGQLNDKQDSGTVPVRIRNGSELPVRVDAVNLAIRPVGYDGMLATPVGTSKVDYYVQRGFARGRPSLVPGTIAPGDTWSSDLRYEPGVVFELPWSLEASITRVVITDAAGYQWEVRSGKAGPARRVRRWRRWRWRRHGNL